MVRRFPMVHAAFIIVPLSAQLALAQDSVCARVRIQIEQEAVVARRAFEATLSISNESADPLDTLENVNVSIVIKDAAGNPANDLFGGLDVPTLTNLTDVTGTGFVGPLDTATAQWLILPTDQAAPSPASVEYFIGGQFSYTRGGTQITVPLFPVRIVVFPDASLFLNYYLQGQVFGDNPFTIDIEPAEPFSLGLLVTNAGFGPATSLRITSGQPEIVENEAGLLIAFQLIGTQVGTQEIAPSLTVDLGSIPAGGNAVARWLMTSTLQGKFIEYNASFEHVNGLNDSRLSIIRAVDIFELNHVILLDDPVDDGLPDFLVNDPPAAQQDDLPDVIHSSDGALLPLTVVLDAVVDGPPTALDMNVVMSANVTQSGWHYFRLDNPGTDQFRLMQAVRDSPLPGKTMTMGNVGNVWTTHRLLPVDAVPTHREDRLYVVDHFDAAGPVSYTLTFDVPPPPSGCQTPADCDDGNPCNGVETCDLLTHQCETTISTDCNGNGIEDSCDLGTGTSQDCNGDGVPNECEIDCQPNGVPDVCDIASGTSTDANGDGVPDECGQCGDLDFDGIVDGTDFAIFLSAFGRSTGDPAYRTGADLDADGTVTLLDFQLWLGCFRQFTGNAAAVAPAVTLQGDYNVDGTIDLADLAMFEICMAGSSEFAFPCQVQFDLNEDRKIGLGDWAGLVEMLRGPIQDDR